MKMPGFSLIEITITMSIVALMASLGFYLLTYYDRLFVHLEINRLYALLCSCSAKAMLLQKYEYIQFFPNTETYSYQGTTYQLGTGVIFGTLPGVQGPPANPQQIPTSPVTFVGNKISIHPDGKIQPGTIYLTDTGKRWLYAITSPVGHVSYLRRYRYFTDQWVLLT
jgi:prepilin-type N-terminal cleavage/methylation domain-containing protein